MPDILDTSIAGSPTTRWFEPGHQIALFAASDLMENKDNDQGEFCEHPNCCGSASSESTAMGVLGTEMMFQDPRWLGPTMQVYLIPSDTYVGMIYGNMISVMKSYSLLESMQTQSYIFFLLF